MIAFAHEGADVAFNDLPADEPDAREVVALIERAGRKVYPLAGRPALGRLLAAARR